MFAYKFRLYPSKNQEMLLLETFDLCRFTYNKLLESLNASKKIKQSEIQHSIVKLKEEFPKLNRVYSKTLQYECCRLFHNLKSLVQLKKKDCLLSRMSLLLKNILWIYPSRWKFLRECLFLISLKPLGRYNRAKVVR